MKIGILAVQGAFIEHEKILTALGADCVEIRQLSDLEGIQGLVLPGGESTVQGQLLRKLDLLEPIRKMIKEGLPVLATCAGLILLSEHLDADDTVHLGTLPVTTRRNAYGRQLGSFSTTGNVKYVGEVPMTFIRAPYIESINTVTEKNTPEENSHTENPEQVEILATVDNHIVAVKYKHQIGLSFHPELTEDSHIHQFFLDMAAS